MGRVWVTSDTHFLHPRVAEIRGYASVQEHDDTLIQRWNATVGPDDIVWHLGDVGLGNEALVLEKVSRLNGHKRLIYGNHDRPWPGHRDARKHVPAWAEVFEYMEAYARIRIEGRPVLLSHFPYSGDHTPTERYTDYRLHDTGKWLLHGHVHDQWALRDRQINVGVDIWLVPLSLDQVARWFTSKEAQWAAHSGNPSPELAA